MEMKWVQRHDIWNLILLPFIFLSTSYYLIFKEESDYYYYAIQYNIFIIYLIMDLIFIILIPQSVGAPDSIIIHHLIVLIGTVGANYSLPIPVRRYVASGFLVELNTWLKFAKRYSNPLLANFFNILFYISWISIRICWFPYLLFISISLFYESYSQDGNVFNCFLLLTIMLSVLLVMNIKWTHELFTKDSYLGRSATSKEI